MAEFTASQVSQRRGNRAAPSSRLTPAPTRAAAPRWFSSPWTMAAAGYVFPPAGMYLMWRYRPWPRWLKATLTVAGSAAAAVSTYVSWRLL